MKILYLPSHWSQQRQKEKPAWIYPVHLAMEATHMRSLGHDVQWEKAWPTYDMRPGADNSYDEIITEPQGIDFLSLPIPDRFWTNAFDKRYQVYGNYKYHPATHMMVASGCWHGKCAFCVEQGNKYQVRLIHSAIREVEICRDMGFKEVFDDSATFPDGSWCENFCHWKMEDKIDITMGCNMRIGADVNFRLMKLAGFRMVLFGIESANQETLDKLRKGTYAEDIIPTIRAAARAGLEPHIAVMFGFPWETAKEEHRTLDLVHLLLSEGYAKTAQASTYSCPGTEPASHNKLVNRIYDVAWSPKFWINKVKDIHNVYDAMYLLKGIRKGLVHD